jgi:flavin-dependent dehydrogenase
VRRTALDKILVDAAVAAGAELRERFSVTAILTENGRFTGIRGHSRGGRTIDEKARVVIGADGLHSLVARTAVAPEYRTRPAITCWYYSYWSGIRTNGVQAYLRERCMSILAPTNDGLTLVLTLWTHDQFHEIRSDIEGNYLRTLRQVPEVGAFLEGGRREERLRGMADVPNFFRKPYGPGWALVGDAGYHKDPVTAQGITDAFRDAELLSDALDSGFSGNRNMEQALQEYEQKRNDAVSEMYEFTCAMASLETPNAEMRQFHQALLRDQQAMDSFFGCLAGTVSSSEFLSPENRQKIIDAAA